MPYPPVSSSLREQERDLSLAYCLANYVNKGLLGIPTLKTCENLDKFPCFFIYLLCGFFACLRFGFCGFFCWVFLVSFEL